MYEVLEPFSEPLLKLSNFKWIIEGNEMSCDKPPHGIVVYFKNVSIVPIEVFNSDLQVFYGLKHFNDVTRNIGDDGNHHILAPGEELSAFSDQPDLFRKHLLQRKQLHDEPTLIVELKVTFSKLKSSEKIIYHTKQKIFFDCEHPLIQSKQAMFENYNYVEIKNA